MHALIVYESMFGNTAAVARAIADGVGQSGSVDLREVSDAPATLPAEIDLLIVGGPTHVHGMTSERSRRTAADQAGIRLVSRGSGIREWLETLVGGSAGTTAAAFDTRVPGPALLTGSAAKAASRRLGAIGLRVVPAESFVLGGPKDQPFDRMSEAELRRARDWGATLGTVAAQRQPIGHAR